jgi:hypothetical protein
VEQLLGQAKEVQGIPRERQDAVDDFVAEICRKQGIDP